MFETKPKTSSKRKNNLKILRIFISLPILLHICWVSYQWWKVEKMNEYEDWHNGIAISKKDGKYGYVDDKFKLFIPHQFDSANQFDEFDRAIVGSKLGNDYRWRLINKKGVYVSEAYDEIQGLGFGRYKVRNRVALSEKEKYQDYHWQVIDVEGRVLTTQKYHVIDPFQEERARVCVLAKCGFMNLSGQVVIGFGQVPNADRYQMVANYSDGTRKNYLDNGQHFSHGLARTQQQGKYGYMDKSGKIVIPVQFLQAENFSEQVAVVKTDAGYGVIDLQGKFVIQPQSNWTDLQSFSEQRSIFREGEYYGMIDKQGRVIVPIDRKYSHIGKVKNGVANIIRDNKYGFVDVNGVEIIPPIYEQLGGEFKNGTVWAISEKQPNVMLHLDKKHNIVRTSELITFSSTH